MAETDRLAKVIAHRQKQEKKNDKLRIHKNKIENDRLLVQVTYLDWNKDLRQREMGAAEGEYMRKLEKIYDRQLIIEEERIKEQEKIRKEKEVRRRRRQLELAAMELGLRNSEAAQEMMEKEHRRQLHGVKQEWSKLFLNKAKSLSGGYRDNDPPLVYYKKKGIVPPERMVTPEVSAEAQANYGGGARIPSSADHLYKSNLPKETPYGIKDQIFSRPGSSSRSARTNSARSGYSSNGMMSSDNDDDETDSALIDEVIRVNVRPSTAPINRQNSNKNNDPSERDGILVTHQVKSLFYNDLQTIGEEPSVQSVEVQNPSGKPPRPATASASVRFKRNLKEPEKTNNTPLHSNRRRGSLRAPNLLMFHKRPSTTAAASGSSSVPTSPRRKNSRDTPQQAMTNIDHDRIKRKMQEKAENLHAERMKRMMMSPTTPTKNTISYRLKTTTTREMPFLEHFMKNKSSYLRGEQSIDPVLSPRINKVKSRKEFDAMMDYIDRIESGIALANSYHAKKVLLEATHERREELASNVQEFIDQR